jgi:hypothetical protein
VNKIVILKKVILDQRLDKADYFIQENVTFCLWLTKSLSNKLVTKSSNKIIKILKHLPSWVLEFICQINVVSARTDQRKLSCCNDWCEL